MITMLSLITRWRNLKSNIERFFLEKNCLQCREFFCFSMFVCLMVLLSPFSTSLSALFLFLLLSVVSSPFVLGCYFFLLSVPGWTTNTFVYRPHPILLLSVLCIRFDTFYCIVLYSILFYFVLPVATSTASFLLRTAHSPAQIGSLSFFHLFCTQMAHIRTLCWVFSIL